MRVIFGLFICASLAWFGYWFIGSSAHEAAVKAWLDDRQNQGWVAEYSDIDVQGFPNRFDTTINDLYLADPNYGWAWIAPQFQILSLSYTPNHFITVWPATQVIATPHKKYNISNTDMRASLVFEPNSTLALDRSTLNIENLKITTSKDEESTIKSALLSTRQSETIEYAHDLAFDAKGFTPSKTLKAWIDPKSILPVLFETVSIKSTIAFDGPWDRTAIEGIKPILTGIDLASFNAQWGEMQLQATGNVTVDAEGYPTGKISIRAKNWQDMIRLVVASGALNASVGKSLEQGLSLLALLSGNKNTLDVPLSFSNRTMSLGPIPIGPAPRLKRY